MDEEIQLKKVKIEDYELLDKYYRLRRPETADSNLFDLYLWNNLDDSRYFVESEGICFVAKDNKGKYFSVSPACKRENLYKYFKKTEKYFNEVLNTKLVMYVVDKEVVDTLDLNEDDYVVVYDRTYADYVYDAKKLQPFPGKSYHKKKNNLNHFKKTYDGLYEFKFLDKEDKDIIFEFLNNWSEYKKDTPEYSMIECELQGIDFVIDNKSKMDYKMAGVFVEGKMQAFTIGTYYSEEDMVYIPVEKANPTMRGLSQYICSEFLKQAYPEASKVNREDDMGIEGLRKSKLSYRPIYLVDKYTIIQK